MSTSRIHSITIAAPRLEESALAAVGLMAGAAVYCTVFFGQELGSAICANSQNGFYGLLLAGVVARRSLCRQKANDSY